MGLPVVGVDEDLRDLGGDSLRTASACVEIDRRLGRKVPMHAVVAHGTVEHLALAMRRGLGLPPGSAMVPLESEGSRRPLFLVSGPVWGPQQFTPLSAQLGPDQPLYAFWPLDQADFATDELRFESLRAREARRTSFVPIEKQAFASYVSRPYSDDVLLVLNEAQTRAYTREPEAAYRGLTDGRVTVRLVKRGGVMRFDDSETSEVGAVLAEELARA